MNKHVTRIKQKGLALLRSLKLITSKKSPDKNKKVKTKLTIWTILAKI